MLNLIIRHNLPIISEGNTIMKVNKENKVISIKDVSNSFHANKKEIKALIKVSFDSYEGEILSILGPNGAGKTTLINMMLGQLSLSHGEMNLLGHSPGKIELKRQCGAMLQLSGLPDMSTIKEHIQLFQSYYSEPMDYQKVIEIAGLKEIENQYSKNLSGGQKQRLLFALSICGNPKLLFLDEPSVGMDIAARRSLWKAITDLKNQGTSIILTTHYLEEADQLSDRIIMLSKGRVIKIGTPKEIKSQIKSKTIRFVSSLKPKLLEKISSINHFSVSEKEEDENQFEIRTDDPVETLKSIFEIGSELTDLSVAGAALEDAFLLLNENSDNLLEESNET